MRVTVILLENNKKKLTDGLKRRIKFIRIRKTKKNTKINIKKIKENIEIQKKRKKNTYLYFIYKKKLKKKMIIRKVNLISNKKKF